MSTGGDEQRGARPSAEWTASIDGPVTSTALHDRANAVVVGVGEESPAGPAVAVFAADDGTRRGRVTLDGRLSGSYYHPDPACLFVRTDADRVYAVDPGTGELAWEAQASGEPLGVPCTRRGAAVADDTPRRHPLAEYRRGRHHSARRPTRRRRREIR